MRRGALVPVLLLVLASCQTETPATKERAGPPNVIVFVTDDQRADGTMEVMPKTLDWFGRGGTRFSNAFDSTPQCCPSRASIFTGRYTHNHGVLSNTPGWAEKLDQTTTIQSQLHDYRRSLVGKYLNGWGIEEPLPDFDGWSFFDREDPTENGYFGVPFNADGTVESIRSYSTDYIADQAVRRIADDAESGPFFAVVAFWAPHAPAIPAKKYADAEVPPFEPPPAADDPLDDEPAFVKELQTPISWTEKLARRQLRTLMSVDDAVDEILGSLSPAELDNTLAFFTSDNGYLWGEYGVTDKTLPYTGSTKVPLLMRWPGHVGEAVVDDRLVSNVDIAATIYDALGIEPPVPLDGHSLLQGPSRDVLLTEYWQKPGHPTLSWASLRGEGFHYVEYYAAPGSDRVVERAFYDLRVDPNELHNLLGDRDRSNDPPTISLHRGLSRARSCEGSECP